VRQGYDTFHDHDLTWLCRLDNCVYSLTLDVLKLTKVLQYHISTPAGERCLDEYAHVAAINTFYFILYLYCSCATSTYLPSSYLVQLQPAPASLFSSYGVPRYILRMVWELNLD
jgi:hypothetical protein